MAPVASTSVAAGGRGTLADTTGHRFHASESPDDHWHPRLDLSLSSSRQHLPGMVQQWALPRNGPCAEQQVPWSSLLSAWECSWFGCELSVHAGDDFTPHLQTYSSVYDGLKSPNYLSSPGNEPGSAYAPWSGDTHRGSYWRPRTTSGGDASSLAAALHHDKRSQQSQQATNRQQYESQITTSAASNEGGASSSAHGILDSSVSCDAPSPALHASSDDKATHNHDSSVTTTELFSQYVLLPPPGSDDSPDSRQQADDRSPALQPAVLGTWVHRQYHMPLPPPPTGLSRSQPSSIANSIPSGQSIPQMRTVQSQEGLDAQQDTIAAALAGPAQQLQGAQQTQQNQATQQDPMDAAMEAAWRWRFTRRWHAEQQRCAEGVQGSPDKHEEALAYLHAGGGAGWNMQVSVARTQSTEASGLHSIGTAGASSLLAGELLLEDGSYPAVGGLARAISRQGTLGGDTATRHVNSLNRRAMHLLEQQRQCEAAAEERWNTSIAAGPNDTWVGQHLATVEIDDWGTFKFLVVRVRGRNDRQRILVRGRNYCSEAQITEDLNRKILQIATQKGCPVETLEVMGGGVMEWRRERDRHLHLHSGFTCAVTLGSTAGKPMSSQELLNLAAVLTKQNLPVHFKVSIQGQ